MSEGLDPEVTAHKNSNPAKPGLNRRDFLSLAALATTGAGIAAGLQGCSSKGTTATASNSAWKFGILSDTQWLATDDGYNPDSSAIAIIQAANQAFIDNGAKFVIHVGDLDNDAYTGSTSGLSGEAIRALFAQPLYNEGIGFFPLRGNHDNLASIATLFQSYYPQTQGGSHNASPAAVTSVSNPDSATQPSPSISGATFTLGSNFSSPDPWGTGNLKGLSYSFDYSSARFILLDQFTPTDGSASSYTQDSSISKQQSWITSRLNGRGSGTLAFVFAHKGLITQNHRDVLFGEYPNSANEAVSGATDTFIKSLASNNAPLFFCGHDHMHDRSLVYTMDGKTASIMQQVCQSDSSKFYTPSIPANDIAYNSPARQVPIRQELYTVGYYIVTIDGQNATVDYYAADVNASTTDTGSNPEFLITTTPALNFTLRETYGYSLIGKQFQIKQGASFTAITDTSSLTYGTVLKVLSGSNQSVATGSSSSKTASTSGSDYSGRALVRVVNTGWASDSKVISDVLYLWGLQSAIGSTQCETYTIQLSFATASITVTQLKSGNFGLATQDSSGNWVNAINGNNGGVTKFVDGAWTSSYSLGTYGIDRTNGVVWAVINYGGKFAVANNI